MENKSGHKRHSLSSESLLLVWHRRRNRHLRANAKYAKYVWNDHFVLFLFFLFGALAFQYGRWIQDLPTDIVWGKPLIALIFALSIFIGRLATLVVPADPVFLAGETAWGSYFRQSYFYSLIAPGIFLIVLSFVPLPFVAVITDSRAVSLWPIMLTLLGGKSLELHFQVLFLRCSDAKVARRVTIGLFGLFFLIFAAALYLQPWVAPFLLLLYTGSLHQLFVRAWEKRFPLWQWEYILAQEQQRDEQQKRLINLFTDVPLTKSLPKRRKFLDPLIQRLDNRNPYRFLYMRAFVRGSEYSGLYVRLLFLGALLLFFSSSLWSELLISLLFSFLTGFQLLALYAHFDHLVIGYLYPRGRDQRLSAFIGLLRYLLVGQAICFGVSVLLSSGFQQAGLTMVTEIIFLFIFLLFFVPRRLKKRYHARL